MPRLISRRAQGVALGARRRKFLPAWGWLPSRGGLIGHGRLLLPDRQPAEPGSSWNAGNAAIFRYSGFCSTVSNRASDFDNSVESGTGVTSSALVEDKVIPGETVKNFCHPSPVVNRSSELLRSLAAA